MSNVFRPPVGDHSRRQRKQRRNIAAPSLTAGQSAFTETRTPPTTGGASTALRSHDRKERFERRIRATRAAMRTERLDALVAVSRGQISQYGDVEFLAGYTPVVRMAFAVLGHEREPVLVVPTPADGWYARRTGMTSDIRVSGTGEVVARQNDLPSVVAAVLHEQGVGAGRIGITGMRSLLALADLETLRAALPDADLVDAGELLGTLKLVKDAGEIDELQRTAAIADAGFEAGRARMRPGVSDWEVVGAIREAIHSRGARDALVFVSAEPYFLSWASGRRFQSGDLVTCYVEIIGPTGYWVEVGGLVAVGSVDSERMRIAEACLRASRAAEHSLVQGALAGDAARAIDAIAAEVGCHAGLWHGHGVGVDHDRPVITADDATRLTADMVIAVHPSLTSADERLGASTVDTYVIGERRPRRLSAIPQAILKAGDER